MNFITIILFGTAAVGMAACADELIIVWIGSDYVIAQPLSVLIGIEILCAGLKNNLGQIRNVSGAFRQAWKRPILSCIINLVVSVALVQVWGIYGVIVGTITADVTTNLIIDPIIIHRVSFENYKTVSEYYKKNLLYVAILVVICAADMWLCSVIFSGFGWLSVLIHMLIVLITVPGVYVLIFRNMPECQYLLRMTNRVIRKLKNKLT